MPAITPAARSVPPSGIRMLMEAAWASGQPFIGMHVGEPNFTPPPHVIAAAQQAYVDGATHYAPNGGIPELRAAIAAKVTAQNGYRAAAGQVVVTPGAAQALQLAFSLVASAGDEVLVPDPGWPNFGMAVQLLQAVPVRYPLRAERGFAVDVDDLEALVTPRTRAILINSPSNPLGTVFDEDTMERLVRFAERHDIWLISDECYDALTFGVDAVSPARFDRSGVVLSVYSFSKTYAMTGVRVGYLVAPPQVAALAANLQEPIVSCVNTPAQHAAVAALEGPQDIVVTMREAYARRRSLAMRRLTAAGIPFVDPKGTFYIWVDLRDRTGGDVMGWALRLLREQHVAIGPGSAFGAGGEGWARLSLAASDEDVDEGIRRIAAMPRQTGRIGAQGTHTSVERPSEASRA